LLLKIGPWIHLTLYNQAEAACAKDSPQRVLLKSSCKGRHG
jgi:hypothetical protein